MSPKLRFNEEPKSLGTDTYSTKFRPDMSVFGILRCLANFKLRSA
ncbi:Uncharacterized protein dnm_047890 [Desulfonema magnum]|uniref:Uncharacterized protein n=1 Tax=Desulfonema magnum TaxID=45655 RepID=A0A975BNY0_9BACT|nr:Uncharacterized protein dnm_047890 [Desulfonema magnum]